MAYNNKDMSKLRISLSERTVSSQLSSIGVDCDKTSAKRYDEMQRSIDALYVHDLFTPTQAMSFYNKLAKKIEKELKINSK